MHVLLHSLIDSLKTVPFIFIIYLIIELFEHKNNTFFSHLLMKSKKVGSVWGALFGVIPQCGFSAIASDLFSKRAISLGTLLAIFISTSDEAIPILLSSSANFSLVLKVIIVKVIIAIFFGIIIDFFYGKYSTKQLCYDNNKHEHFHGNCENCDGGMVKSALLHTIKIFIFIFIVTLLFSFITESFGEKLLYSILLKDTIFQPFIAALIGLIPNCAASVLLTWSFLSGAISFGSLIAGLTCSAGVGILLLFKKNKSFRQNIIITLLLYIIGAFSGFVLHLSGLII